LEAFVALLEALNICCRQLEKDLGTWATYAPTDTDAKRKLHRTVLLLLLRIKLLQVFELDNYLCERVNGGRNVVWLEFSMAFIRTAVHEKIVDMKELPKTMDALVELSKNDVIVIRLLNGYVPLKKLALQEKKDPALTFPLRSLQMHQVQVQILFSSPLTNRAAAFLQHHWPTWRALLHVPVNPSNPFPVMILKD